MHKATHVEIYSKLCLPHLPQLMVLFPPFIIHTPPIKFSSLQYYLLPYSKPLTLHPQDNQHNY